MSRSLFEVLAYLGWWYLLLTRLGFPPSLDANALAREVEGRHLPVDIVQGVVDHKDWWLEVLELHPNRGIEVNPSCHPHSFTFFSCTYNFLDKLRCSTFLNQNYPRINMKMGLKSILVNSTVTWDASFLLPIAADFSKYSAILLACILKESDWGLKVGPFDLMAICFPHGPWVHTQRSNVLASSLSSTFQENRLVYSLLTAAFKEPRTCWAFLQLGSTVDS